ncbi:MAG: hypothetical protein ACYS18_05075 [Planctomycetota bacterium]|jgi:hypothetical protein
MNPRKYKSLFIVAAFLILPCSLSAQEKFIDVRQEMADNLSEVKKNISADDWASALENFNKTKNIWSTEVITLLNEDQQTEKRFSEYFERINSIQADIDSLALLITQKKTDQIESKVNHIIWGISHHPQGFDVPDPVYTVWDWVFGLGIGLGFCVFITCFGLYLRKSYYRRYAKQES